MQDTLLLKIQTGQAGKTDQLAKPMLYSIKHSLQSPNPRLKSWAHTGGESLGPLRNPGQGGAQDNEMFSLKKGGGLRE